MKLQHNSSLASRLIVSTGFHTPLNLFLAYYDDSSRESYALKNGGSILFPDTLYLPSCDSDIVMDPLNPFFSNSCIVGTILPAHEEISKEVTKYVSLRGLGTLTMVDSFCGNATRSSIRNATMSSIRYFENHVSYFVHRE